MVKRSAKPIAPRPARGAARMRADLALVEQGLAPSRERARALILAGEVLAVDRPVAKAGDLVDAAAPLRLRSEPMPYVSRGGIKLAHALDTFAIDPKGLGALDVGASTGGFSDCLLQRGVGRLVCLDVGYGQLDPKVARDPRVQVIDRMNARHLVAAQLPFAPDLVVIDVSFISLALVLPAVLSVLAPGGRVVALVKPQFEVGRAHVGKGGIVRDETARAAALDRVIEGARGLGFTVLGHTTSPITGGKGNVEYLLALAGQGA